MDIARWCAGLVASVAGLFAPVVHLLACVIVFIVIDFITGIWASYRRAKEKKTHWALSSSKMWRTIEKLFFSLFTIVLAHLIAVYILPFIPLSQHLPNICCAFICGVEFWSFLENAGEISHARVFRWIRSYTIRKADKLDSDISETMKDQ